MITQTYRPFSNGTEYDMWYCANCGQCAKHDLEAAPICADDDALLSALFDDGKITQEAAEFIGTTDRPIQDNSLGFCTLNSSCAHFEQRA